MSGNKEDNCNLAGS